MRDGWLLFGALGGPIFWALRLVIAYPLVPVACAQKSILLPGLVSLVALAGTVAAGLVSLSLLRRAGSPSRARFMAKSGVALAALFALVILAESVPMLFGDPCLEVEFEPRRTRWSQGALGLLQVSEASAHRLAEIPPPEVAWRTWNPDPLMLGALVFGVASFVRGLRGRRVPRVHAARRARSRRLEATLYGAGLLALAVALLSPLDTMGGLLFSAHMAQHLVLMLVAAPLIALARPGLVMAASVPPRARRVLGRLWRRAGPVRSVTRGAGHPLSALALHVAAVWVWHVPRFYDAALEHEALHVLEHVSFFAAAWLFWSALGRCARGAHGGPLAGLGVLFVAMLSMGLLSALLAVAPDAWYPPHAAGTEGWSLTPLEDQQLAGLLMWVPGGLVYLLAAMLLGSALLKEGARKPLRIPPMPERETAR